MSSTFNNFMREVCRQALENDFARLERSDVSDTPIRLLDEKEVPTLALKITALPAEYMNTLFLRYYFNFSPEDTNAMLVTTHSIGRLRYTKSMLSHFMGLDDAVVDDHSMRLACEAALSEYTAHAPRNVWRIPKYSNAFRKKLKLIKAAQKSASMAVVVMKRVAVFILICAISFSTALVANAKLRERFLNWVVETFPKFSIFTTQIEEPSTVAAVSQSDIEFGYLPDEYELKDISQGRRMLMYNFLSGDGDKLLKISFVISQPGAKAYFNTENVEIQCVPFKKSDAYTWKTDNITCFIWLEENIECQIFGNIDYDEIIKIAENIKLKK